MVDSGAVAYLAPLIQHPDGKLKRQVCSALAQIAKHSVDLAEVVVEAEVFPKVLGCLKDLDLVVRKNAATLIREISKHTPEVHYHLCKVKLLLITRPVFSRSWPN